MSYVYSQRLIEYAIRIGVDDLLKDPDLVKLAFFTDPQENLGVNLTPPGQVSPQVHEPIPTDFFQKRLSQIQRSKSETGKHDFFKNSIPSVIDIQKYLQNANISIRHSFPREAQDLPCIAITLGNESETGGVQYLGTRKGVITVPQTKANYNIIGSDWSTQYQLHIITPNADEVEVWYFILKYCLTVYRPALEAYGMRSQSLSFGDLEPAPEYLQAGLFVYQRVATLDCTKEEDIPLPIEGVFGQLGFAVSSPQFPQGSGELIPTPGPLEPSP